MIIRDDIFIVFKVVMCKGNAGGSQAVFDVAAGGAG